MQVFAVSSSNAFLSILGNSFLYISIGLLVLSVILVVLRVARKQTAIRTIWIIAVLITAFALIVPGATIGAGTGTNTVTVGHGYVAINAHFLGKKNYSSSDFKYAFMENLNSGNVTLKVRTEGTSFGNVNEGYYTTSSGATAYVVSDNVTDVVALLSSGIYLIIGTNNTQAFASYFSSNVIPVSGIQAG